MLRGVPSLARHLTAYRMCSRSLSAVSYEAFGVPDQVLKINKGAAQAAAPTGNQVTVQMKTAMIDSEDILSITGAGALRQTPGVAGIHGIGVVTAVGPAPSAFKPKDAVMVTSADIGTWQNHLLVSAPHENLVKLPAGLESNGLFPAAVTAALALKSAPLQPGDVILQNNGHSAVSRAVTQLAKHLNLKVVTVATEGAETSGLQGDLIVQSSEVGTQGFNTKVKALGKVKLVLDSVGDRAASNLSRLLAPQGVFTVVGTNPELMAAVKFPVRALIFDDIAVKGVNYHRAARQDPAGLAAIVSEVAGLVTQRKVTLEGKAYSLDDVNSAVKAVEQGAAAYFKL